MKSAHVCRVPLSGESDAETYTVTLSPVAAVVGPPFQTVVPRSIRDHEGRFALPSMASAES